MLTGDAVDMWLITRDFDITAARQLALPLPPGSLKYHPVGKAIGRADVDGPELIRPITPEEAEAEAAAAVKPKKKVASGGGGQLDLF